MTNSLKKVPGAGSSRN